jgi:hypothetical protein
LRTGLGYRDCLFAHVSTSTRGTRIMCQLYLIYEGKTTLWPRVTIFILVLGPQAGELTVVGFSRTRRQGRVTVNRERITVRSRVRRGPE